MPLTGQATRGHPPYLEPDEVNAIFKGEQCSFEGVSPSIGRLIEINADDIH